jgi:hypothetical protein
MVARKVKTKRSSAGSVRLVKELRHLIDRRHEIDNQIVELIGNALGSIEESLCQVPPAPLRALAHRPEKEGLTALIRKVLKRSDWLSPTDIRDALSEEGVDVKVYSNILAEVHVILRRLEESAAVEVDRSMPRRSLYRWTGTAGGAPSGRKARKEP